MKKIFTIALVMLFAFSMSAQNFELAPKSKSVNQNLVETESMQKSSVKGVIFEDDFEASSGWTLEAPFEIGTASIEPDAAHSGTEILGGPLNGDYPNDQTQVSAISPVIDCSGETVVLFGYWSFSGCESSTFDRIAIEVFDGSSWNQIWSNTDWGGSVQEDAWTYYEFDVTAYAAGNADFQVKYSLGTTDGSVQYSGWGIDDFSIFTPEDNDLGANSVSPAGVIMTGSTITPQVTIQNYGGLAQSTYNITLVSDPAGYDETISDPATIDPGNTLTVDFPKWAPADGNYTLTASVVLIDDANPGNDVATSNIEVRGVDFGDVAYSFEAEAAGCPGIETDGTHIYTVYWNPGSSGRNFDKYTMDGTFVEEFEITGVSAVRDMAYNHNTGYFYGAAANTSLFELDLDAQTLENTITIPTDSRAILYNDDDDTFWANNWDSDLTEFDITGTATGNTMAVTSMYGAAYDNWTDPENPTIWAFTTDAATPANTIIEYNMDGTLTGREIDPSVVPGFDAGIGGGLASFEADGVAYLLANIQQDPNLIVAFYLTSPEAVTYSVTFNVEAGNGAIAATANGTDITSGDDVLEGSEVVFTANPDAGWIVADWYIDGSPIGATDLTYTIASLDASVDVTVEFVETTTTYPVTFDVEAGNGAITATAEGVDITSGDNVLENSEVIFTANPDAGWKVADWYVDGSPIGATDLTYTIALLDASVDVTVEFVETTTTYPVTFDVETGNGAITATAEGNDISSGDDVLESSEVIFTATPDAGWEVADWYVDGSPIGATDPTYTIASLDATVDVTVEFTEITYTVTFTVDDGTDPLDGVNITIDDQDLTTDASGVAAIELANGDYPWTATLSGYNEETGTLNVNGAAQDVDISMDLTTYTVTFTVTDGDETIEGATVTFDGDEYTTDADGTVAITDVIDGTYAYSVTIDGYNTETGDIVVDGIDVEKTITLSITGINNGLFSNLKVYPNPFNKEIIITNADKVNRVVITNVNGQQVMDVSLKGTKTINTSKLTSGIYLITFEKINGDRAILKMVKK